MGLLLHPGANMALWWGAGARCLPASPRHGRGWHVLGLAETSQAVTSAVPHHITMRMCAAPGTVVGCNLMLTICDYDEGMKSTIQSYDGCSLLTTPVTYCVCNIVQCCTHSRSQTSPGRQTFWVHFTPCMAQKVSVTTPSSTARPLPRTPSAQSRLQQPSIPSLVTTPHRSPPRGGSNLTQFHPQATSPQCQAQPTTPPSTGRGRQTWAGRRRWWRSCWRRGC